MEPQQVTSNKYIWWKQRLTPAICGHLKLQRYTYAKIFSIFGFPNRLWLKDGRQNQSSDELVGYSPHSTFHYEEGQDDALVYGSSHRKIVIWRDWATTNLQIYYEPGPLLLLKYSASDTPTPKIGWHMDGLPLPNNVRLMIDQYFEMFGDVLSHVNMHICGEVKGWQWIQVQSNIASRYHIWYVGTSTVSGANIITNKYQ